MSFVMSILFATDLHFPRFHRIFALAREARVCFPFLMQKSEPAPTDPPSPLKGGFAIHLFAGRMPPLRGMGELLRGLLVDL